jgi:predicted Zn finger-like uncharacterized protein
LSDSELRYTFVCPSCSSSFSISLDRIPPVQARFSCPKCSKPMDFPSRDEARVFIQLQSAGGSADGPAAAAGAAAAAAPRPIPPPPAPPPPPARPAAPPPVPEAPAADKADRSYRVSGKGFENDVFDRRAMRNLIRSFGVKEGDLVSVNEAVAVRASDIPELKSLFELRKTARATPPPVCRSHTEVVAHYVCADSSRPLCEDCAPEKKFGGTSLRVCDHCGGTAKDLHEAPAEID